MSKATHRNTIIHTLNQLSPTEKAAASAQICKKLTQWLTTHQPNQLGAFVPVRHEPNIWPVLLDYAKTNELYLPKFNPTTNGYDWGPYSDPLSPSKFNIPEPATACSKPPQLDACLVPAVGIDPNGNRIGWGYGYFDRLLTTDIPHRIGIVFDCQLLPTPITPAAWDVALTSALTTREPKFI